MLIIVEGVDKTGKSTLCEYLVKNLPNAYFLKNGSKPLDNSEKERKKIIDIYNNILDIYDDYFKDKILIIDRFLLSEYVYSYKRGYESYGNPDLKKVNNRLKKIKDVFIIYTKLDIKIIKERFISEKEDYAKIDDIETLIKRYDENINRIGIDFITYNYTITSKEKIARYIEMTKLKED